MGKELNENTAFNVSIKTLVGIGVVMASFISMWFMLKADIAEAKTLPKQEVTRVEYELKDELIRNTILQTQQDIIKMQESLDRIEDKIYDR
jgi:ribosomal protein S13